MARCSGPIPSAQRIPGRSCPPTTASRSRLPTAWRASYPTCFKNVRVEKTGVGPDWPEDAERPEDPSGLYYVSPLPREAYLTPRQTNVPMTCVQAEMGTSYCVAFDPEFDDVANTFYSALS